MKQIPSAARLILCLAAVAICLAVVSGAQAQTQNKTLRLAHTDWSSSVASANLIKAVLEEKLGISCKLMPMDAEKMWQSVAEGRADAMASAWLPDTHSMYYSQYKDQVKDLGPNLEGTKIGLVIPNITLGRLTAGTGIRNKPYIPIDSITELKQHADKFNRRIIGIEPEAGITHKAREAMEVYGLKEFRLQEGSEVAMMAELSHAVQHQKWIVFTGWLPHWSFARWNLKFLDDPENVFGGAGSIHTMVRKGLKKDMPKAYQVLDRFFWTPEQVGQLMLWIREDNGLFPFEKAMRWMRTHPEEVADWIKQERKPHRR